MQMEEVRPVLHAIFRCLLKTLDDGELRDRRWVRQGKTCLVFHISSFWDHIRGGLWLLWTAAQMPDKAHRFSTEVVTTGLAAYR
jgi:hypothetical protein